MQRQYHLSSGRTPLFRQVKSWMAQAAQREPAPPSRREVLLAAGVGTAALAASKLQAFAGPVPRIVIVGAGLAGLNAAYQLKKKGVRTEIYEGSGRSGGRVMTARNAMGTGLTTELGGEYIDSGHKDMRDLCREFGLALRDFAKPSEQGFETTYLFGGQSLTEAQIIQAFKPVAKRMEQDIKAFEFDSYASYNQRAFELDNTSIADYLTQVGATGWLYDLLDVAYNIEYGLESSQQSSLNLLYLIGTKTNQGLELFGDSDERFTLVDGNDALTCAMANALSDRITLGHKLVSIAPRGQGYRLTFHKTGGGTRTVDCDIALITIPFTLLRDVDIQVPLPPVKRQAIDSLGYGTNAKLVLGFNQRFWRQANRSGEYFTDNGLQSGWDSSRLQPGSEGTLTYYSGGANGVAVGVGTPEMQRNAALPRFEQLFPGATSRHNGRVLRFHWPSFAWSKGSYACYKVGQYTQFSGAEFEPVGNLLFAGEHCSSDFQGYMNGAAETGRIAASEIWRRIR